jgi:hypothetical protein
MAQYGKSSHHCGAYGKMTGRSAETSRSFRQREAQMKAIVYHNCGSPDDVLERQGIDKPVVKDMVVLV